MKRNITTLLSFIFIAASLPVCAGVKLIPADEGLGFSFSSEKFKPVVIQPGSIFYETASGRTILTPVSEYKDFNDSLMRWKSQDGRTISVSTTASENGYDISFSAKPSDDIQKWGISIKAAPDEFFTGVYERTVDGKQNESWKPGMTEAMNMRGQLAEMIVQPTTAVYAPFYVSSAGYGLFVKTTWPGVFDFCRYDKKAVTIHFEGPSFNAKLFMDDDLSEVVRSHALESGPPILPPKWAFSHWRWRDNHTNSKTYYDGTPVQAPYNSQVVEDILMMKAFDIPCGVYWLDRPWCTGSHGYDDFNWDQERFPNPQAMIKWLGGMDTKLLLWIAPWVQGEMYKEAVDKGYRLNGQAGATGTRAKIDYSNPAARQWWQQGLEKVLDDGVAGFKLDRSEELTPNDRSIKCYDGRTTREMHNDYPVMYVRATWEACKKARGDDFILLPRAAYTGSTKYAAFWGGDISPTEWGLRASIIAVQKSAILGYPFWGSDTGGYNKPNEHEVCARWVAFSCFCPIMEVGPTDDRAFWDMASEPSYDTNLIATWRMYAKLHTNLIDYSYKFAKIAHQTGMPIVRPLFVAYPKQKAAYQDWETYLYGSDILVSPIWKKGTTKKSVYLPAGEEWIDAWNTKKAYKGGQSVEVDVPLYKIPIFIRKGSGVKLGDLEALYQESLKLAGKKPDLGELQKTVK